MLKNLFKRRAKVFTNEELNDMGIKTIEVERTEVDRIGFDLDRVKFKYRIVDTDEIVEFEYGDEKAFDKMMTLGKSVEMLFD